MTTDEISRNNWTRSRQWLLNVRGRVGSWFRTLLSREAAVDDGEYEHMRSWSISAQLAAVPPSYLDQVPSEVASLIRAAKDLHPQMAVGAWDRYLRGEPCPPLG